jgi:diacylglycerol O-acyltransferase
MVSPRESMSPVDTAWLRMEKPTNLMMIGVVFIFDSRINIDEFKEITSERLLKYHRFTQRAVERDGTTWWEDDPYFNIDNHIHLVGLPGKGTKQDLQNFTSDLNSTPLSFTRPLWQAHVIDKYKKGSVIIFRIHHAIADGISLTRVMLSLMDTETAALTKHHNTAPYKSRSLLKKLVPSTKLIRQSFQFGQELLEDGIDLIKHPDQLVDMAIEGATVAAELTRIAALPSDPATCFKRELTGRKKVAWAEPLSLAEVRKTAKILGASINDVLLTAAAGAIRQYLVAKRQPIDFDQFHVVVPVNLRPLDKPITTLGNQFGLVVVELPVGTADCFERMGKVKKAMDLLKKSSQAQVFLGLLSVLGKGPEILEQTALETLSKKASLVMTNVPGPEQAMYMAGSKLTQPMVWVPQSGRVGVGLSILSYHGDVQFGVVSDENMVNDPDLLVEYFLTSFAELSALAIASET